MLVSAFLPTFMALSGCNPDRLESEDATDEMVTSSSSATSPDRDGDGLTDALEAELGLDPDRADTDGDGYEDGDEVHAGTDPADAESVIYKGGWPYYAGKSDITPSSADVMRVGDVCRDFVGRDAYGDDVHLHDFYGESDRYVVLLLSAAWCEPCLSLNDALTSDDGGWFADRWPTVHSSLLGGDLYLIDVLVEGEGGSSATVPDLREWHQAFPHEQIPMLKDDGYEMAFYSEACGPLGSDDARCSYPSAVVLRGDMTVNWMAHSEDQTHEDGLDWLEALLSDMAGQ